MILSRVTLLSLLMGSIPLTCQLAYAQQTNTEESKIADFSTAIEQLIALGFPDSLGAKYVGIDLDYYNDQHSPLGDLEDQVKLTGGYWLLPSNDGSAKVILGSGEVFEYRQSQQRFNGNLSSGSPLTAPHKLGDFDKDYSTIITLLDKLDSEEETSFYNDDSYKISVLRLGIFAHRAGHKEKGNALIQRILANSEIPEAHIDALISQIASLEYTKITQNFYASADWKSYHQDLLAIQNRFPRGWNQRHGLSILLPQIQQRANNTPVPLPKIEGVTFSAEIKALLEQTGSRTQLPPPSYNQSSAWVIEPAPVQQNNPFQQLTAHGLDGFIALASLLGDQTLVIAQDHGYSNYSDYSISYSSFDSSYESPAEQALRSYASMMRPRTRGELAKQIISPIIATNNSNIDSSTALSEEEMRSQAIDWWREHRKDTPLELCSYFLEHGSSQMSAIVATKLISINSTESIAIFEKCVLTNESPSSLSSLVKPYALKRKQEAIPFLTKYKEALTNELGDGKDTDYHSSGQYEIAQAGGVEKYIAKLLRYTEPLKPKQLLTRLSRKSAETTEILEQIAPALEGKPWGELRAKFIYAAAKSPPQKASQIIAFLTRFTTTPPEDFSKAFSPPLSKFEIEDWNKLLSSEGNERNLMNLSYLLESLSRPDFDVNLLQQCYYSLPSHSRSALIRKRSAAILAGTHPGKLPTAMDLSEEDLKTLTSEIAATPAEQMHPRLLELTPSETLAFQARVTGANAAPPSYLKAAKIITALQYPTSKDEQAYSTQGEILSEALLNRELNTDTLATLASTITKNLQQFSSVGLYLGPNSATVGFEVILTAPNETFEGRFKQINDLNTQLQNKEIEHYVAISRNQFDEEAHFLIWTNISSPSKEQLSAASAEKGIAHPENFDPRFIFCANQESHKAKLEKLNNSGSDRAKAIELLKQHMGEDLLNQLDDAQIQQFYKAINDSKN